MPRPLSTTSGGGRRVAVFTAYFPPAYLGGGPARTLGALVTHLPDETSAVVLARDTDLGGEAPLDVPRDVWVGRGDAQVRFISPGSIASWWRAIAAVRSFGPDLVYVNSFFDPRFSLLPRVLARLRVFGRASILLAPRGEFSAGALALKPTKKHVFLRLSSFLGLHRGIVWHASTARERDDIRRIIGSDVIVVVREDDTDLPLAAAEVPARPPGPLRAVHVSRLVPMKGLDVLLTALGTVSTSLVLDVFGPSEDRAFADRCRRLADDLPQHVTVTFRGPLAHAAVRPTLAAYDVMLFATRGENFGHVVAESLSVACPVMCPDSTPWSPWLLAGGGVVIAPDTIAGWSRAIGEYAARSPDELRHAREEAATAYEAWRREALERPHLFTILTGARSSS